MANKKRTSGEGTAIEKRPDGRWWCRVSVNGERLSIYGKSEGEVKSKRDEILDLARKNLYIKPTKQTFGEWLDLWLKEYAKPAIRPTTYDSYESLIRAHIIPGLGNVLLKELQPNQIQKFYNQKLQEKLIDRRSKTTREKEAEKVKAGEGTAKELKSFSARTVRYMHIIINSALEQALKEGKIIRNPAEATRPPKAEKKEARYLTPDQLAEFLDTISKDRWYFAFMVDINSGLRRGELCALKWENVDLKKGVITVKMAVSRVKDENGKWVLYFHAPKSQKGLRSIPLPAGAVEVLKSLKARQAAEELRLKITGRYKNDGFVFTWEDGKMVEPTYLSKHFLKLIRKHGLSVNFHGLRHSYATALLQAGVHPKIAQELLGDSTISVVLDTYSHVTPGLKEKAASTLEGIFDKKKPSSAKEG